MKIPLKQRVLQWFVITITFIDTTILLLLLYDPQQKRARRASERLLRIIEKVGILFAFTFNMTDNDSQNELFNDSHIGKCFQGNIRS